MASNKVWNKSRCNPYNMNSNKHCDLYADYVEPLVAPYILSATVVDTILTVKLRDPNDSTTTYKFYLNQIDGEDSVFSLDLTNDNLYTFYIEENRQYYISCDSAEIVDGVVDKQSPLSNTILVGATSVCYNSIGSKTGSEWNLDYPLNNDCPMCTGCYFSIGGKTGVLWNLDAPLLDECYLCKG